MGTGERIRVPIPAASMQTSRDASVMACTADNHQRRVYPLKMQGTMQPRVLDWRRRRLLLLFPEFAYGTQHRCLFLQVGGYPGKVEIGTLVA